VINLPVISPGEESPGEMSPDEVNKPKINAYKNVQTGIVNDASKTHIFTF